MFSTREDALSSNELRDRLFKRFKEKRVQGMLQAQLRTQLIRELKPLPFTSEPAPRPVPVKSRSVLVPACNIIVANHLHCLGYDYTFSVFCPESNLCTGKIFGKEDILQLLEISPYSPLSRSLLFDEESNHQGFLIKLLTYVTRSHAPHLYHDASTQTASIVNGGESLAQKIKMMEKEYNDCSEDEKVLSESKLETYRRDIETQAQMDVNVKMQFFEDVEIAKPRMEIKVQFQKEFDKVRQELEMTSGIKAKALNAKENNMIDRLKKEQETKENNVLVQRQELLTEMETLLQQENELRKQMEAFKEICKIHDEKVNTIKELLRRRALVIKTTEDTYDHRVQKELSKYELEVKDEYFKRTDELTDSKQRMELETISVHNELAEISVKAEDHSKIGSEVKQLQDELKAAQQTTSVLNQQKELLRDKLESMSDYPRLKSEKATLEERVHLLETQLESLKRMCADLEKPSQEQQALQSELRRLQTEQKLEKEAFNNQKQVLQTQLWIKVEQCGQLKIQLTECEEKLQWFTGHVEDLQKRLHQNQEFKRCLQAISKSDKQVCSRKHVNQTMPIGTTGCIMQRHESCGNPNMELGIEPRAWILQLQKEAEAFQEAYRKCLAHQGCKEKKNRTISDGTTENREEDRYIDDEWRQRHMGDIEKFRAC
ncbi:centriole and centriolar satellite protein ofd1-like [Phycodurus eques]|uniref:centriole and centriolar satellite protein ofd1-like n=1 Tax=Phycodurus eques TaxID=693459 RepID=UPI002ACEB8DD|nr:centriole and centriolar satellite protein ofd1-like [Phycodurus eques]